MNSSRNRAAIMAVTLAATLLTACGSDDADSAKPQSGGTLVDYSTLASGTPDTLDPNISGLSTSSSIDTLLFSGLTTTDEAGNVQKEVASDYSSSDNATMWKFTLRDDVKFSDGSPVLPSSFKRSWERALNPDLNSDVSYRVQQIATSEDATTLDNVVIDDDKRTLSIKLPVSTSNLPMILTSNVFVPVPENVPNDRSWGDTVMNGNGPYKLDAPFKAGETLKLVRNPNYAGSGEKRTKPYLDAIEMRSFSDVDSAYREFAAGKGDISLFPQSAAADLGKFQKENVIIKPTLGVEGLGFSANSATVGGADSLKLRQAIDAAIDKAQINTDVYAGTHVVASQFTPSAIQGAEPASSDGKANVDKAKQLLQEWGKPVPQIKISYSDAVDPKLANIAVDNLVAAGIPADGDPEADETYFENAGGGKYDLFLFNWFADNPSYQAMLEPPFASSSSSNLFGYKNDKVDELFTNAQRASSTDASNGFYRDAEKIILDDQAYISIDWTATNIIKNSYVHNVITNSAGNIDYTKVWLSAKPAA